MTDVASDLGQTRFLEVVLPEQANHYGTLYGANALQLMGKAAFVCATRHARCPVVMAKADSIEFLRPVRLGSVIELRARIAFQGQSSMTVLVDILPEQSGARETSPAISGRFMMVAVDDNGIPVPISLSTAAHQEGTRS